MQLDGGERGVNLWPDAVPGQPRVLQSEGDVTPGVLGDDGIGRVLQDEPQPPTDADVTSQVAGDRGSQRPAQGVQQGRLPRAGRPDHEHPLARIDCQGDVVERRRTSTHGSPRQPLDPDGSGFEGDGWRGHLDGQTQSSPASSRPAGKASSTPARPRARTSSQLPTPATTMPESAKKPRYATLWSKVQSG